MQAENIHSLIEELSSTLSETISKCVNENPSLSPSDISQLFFGSIFVTLTNQLKQNKDSNLIFFELLNEIPFFIRKLSTAYTQACCQFTNTKTISVETILIRSQKDILNSICDSLKSFLDNYTNTDSSAVAINILSESFNMVKDNQSTVESSTAKNRSKEFH